MRAIYTMLLIRILIDEAIALITALSMPPFDKKLAAPEQLEKNLIKLEILVKNLRKRQKRLASSIAG
jgi:hypothetical protein